MKPPVSSEKPNSQLREASSSRIVRTGRRTENDGSFDAIQTPTVVMDGSEDHMVIRRWVRRYAATMRHARYIEIDGCGHVVPQEAPDHVIDALRSLLATD